MTTTILHESEVQMTDRPEWPEFHKLSAEEMFYQIERGWPMLKEYPLPQYDNSLPEFRYKSQIPQEKE